MPHRTRAVSPALARMLMALASLVCMASSTSGAAELVGYVVGPNNIPVSSAQLELKSTGSTRSSLQTHSDAQGYFRFAALDSPLPWTLTVDADGYAPLSQSVLPQTGKPRTVLSIRLTPNRSGVGEISELAETRSLEPLLGPTLTRPESALQRHPDTLGVLESAAGLETSPTWPDQPLATQGPRVLGALAPEQTWLLDGFDVSHPLGIGPAIRVPLEFTRRIEVAGAAPALSDATGTGPAIGVATRFGTNALRRESFLMLEPYSDPSSPRQDLDPDGEVVATRRDQPLAGATLGATLEGAIVPDRIWFFVGLAPSLALGVTEATLASVSRTEDRLAWQLPAMLRMTLNLSPDQTLQVGAYVQAQELRGVIRAPSDFSTGILGAPSSYLGITAQQATLAQGRYVLRLPLWRTRLSLQGGYLFTLQQLTPDPRDLNGDGLADGDASSRRYDTTYTLSSGECSGEDCVVTGYRTGGYGERHLRQTDRWLGELSGAHRLRELVGEHLIEWRVQGRIESLEHTQGFTGSRMEFVRAGETGLELETWQLRGFDGQTGTVGEVGSEVTSQVLSAWIQESWNPISPLQLRLGLRLDQQTLIDRSLQRSALPTWPSVSARASYQFQVAGQRGMLSVGLSQAGSAVPLWWADTLYASPTVQISRSALGISARGNTETPSPAAYEVPATPSSRYRLDTALRVPSRRDAVLKLEQQLATRWTAGAAVFGQTLLSAVEGLLEPDGAVVLSNPPAGTAETGLEPCTLLVSAVQGGEVTVCRASPARELRGLELTVERHPVGAERATLRASWLLSRLTGTYPGPVPTSPGRDPYSVTTLYSSLNPGSQTSSLQSGPLPGDRRHRLYGELSVPLPAHLRVGLASSLVSGAPLDALAPGPTGTSGWTFLAARGAGGRGPWVYGQHVLAGYERKDEQGRGLRLEVAVFNLLRATTALRQDPRLVLNAASVPEGEGAAVPEVATLRCTDDVSADASCRENAGYGESLEAQAPLSVRLGASWRF